MILAGAEPVLGAVYFWALALDRLDSSPDTASKDASVQLRILHEATGGMRSASNTHQRSYRRKAAGRAKRKYEEKRPKAVQTLQKLPVLVLGYCELDSTASTTAATKIQEQESLMPGKS